MAAAGPEAAVARLQHVSHRYGTVAALSDVGVQVPARQMVGVIGPDGVGKSTLLALVSGVRRIQAGQVWVLGGDMADPAHRAAQRPRIAYMPQGLGRNLYPTLSVQENLDFFGRLFGQGRAERRARIASLLHATGLDGFEARPAGKLSGGMKQKLSLCCALIHDPDLLILDEPTTGVDPLSRGQFWHLIDSIRARRPQMSVIVATAYMEEAQRFDTLLAMDGGRVIAAGSPADILARTGAPTLEAAFIALLPEDKRRQHQAVIVRPRVADPNEPPVIEAEGLTRRFGGFVAVDHVSFRIGRGEIFGFLGSNGCGKSTTMKMLTGLLPATQGTAKLFGRPMDAGNMAMRYQVGYMSQGFSLYSELTVLQNLVLHARLYHLPKADIAPRIAALLQRYGLQAVAGQKPDALPLGIKQRLQLAVAVLHRPALLILDEPTSGVDPIARDSFWATLIDLSRTDGVTIFISTHFMNEAERCDRISLMHAGKVLAVGAPADLVRQQGGASLEQTFIAYLAEAAGIDPTPTPEPAPAPAPASAPHAKPGRFDRRRLWACTRREAAELLRDPIRLVFALAGPILLMLAFGFGITFDVDELRYAAFDQDRTPQSRELLDQFAGSRYFVERPPVTSAEQADRRLVQGDVELVIEIPPGFGRDLLQGRQPQVAAWIDGSMPFRGETARGYVTGVAQGYLQRLATERLGPNATPATIDVAARFRYNQSFESANAMVPNVIMLLLVLIPAIMSAVAVVREKETGSIANFRSTPITAFEFLAGKLLPYAAVAMVSFVLLLGLALVVFGVPLKGSFPVLLAGAVLYVFAAAGFGQLISTFVRTQVAAVFATAILTIIPTLNFSGLVVPVASLSGGARLIGMGFPAAWFQPVSVGVFTKGLGLADLWPDLLAIAGFAVLFLGLSTLLLGKQEA